MELRGNTLIMGSVTKEQNLACWHRVRGKVWVEVRLRGVAGTRVRRALWATMRYSGFIVTSVRTFEDVIARKGRGYTWISESHSNVYSGSRGVQVTSLAGEGNIHV